MRSLYAPVHEEMEQVEQLLLDQVHSDQSFVKLLLAHGFRLRGKRMRPALVLLSGKACGRVGSEHLALAAAMEMVHTATLIHDDVLDEATIRRHLDTVNARWGNEVSVLLGDYLFALSTCLINSLDDAYVSRTIGDASRWTCEGELRQVESRGNFGLSEDQYLEIVEAKTAALCSCCCRLGAYYAGADQARQEVLAAYGLRLGIAFQITDDVLDLAGDERETGKSLGTDLAKQKPTLPLIRLLARSSAEQRSGIVALLSNNDHHASKVLQPYWDRSDALEYAGRKAIDFAAQAKTQLAELPASRAREALEGLADFVVTRQQ
jgi:octaprenyl-diphosphate synthase